MKAFSWTYSKLKNSDVCPRKYHQVDILKKFKDSTDQLMYGIKVHDALKDAIKGDRPLPDSFVDYQYWVDWARGLEGHKLVENKWALDRNFNETEYFGPRVWMRLHGDFINIAPNGRVAILADWKTGKRIEDPVQLWLSALCLFAHHPDVEIVQAMFVWLKECDGKNNGSCISVERIHRVNQAALWEKVLPRAEELERRHIQDDFPAWPGRHCTWCPVSSCEHYGTRGNR
jgi:hypothetical protein